MRRHSTIEASQQKLLRRVRAELRDLSPPPAHGLAAYRQSFLRSLPDSLRASNKTALKKAAASSRVVLVGDFHPFRQSQKGFLRIIRESLRPGEKAILALEFVTQAHQTAIDQFQSGYITINELREMIRFDSEWPFSWESYREILLFGRDQGLQMLALNIPVTRGDGAGLRARDEAAATRIAEALWAEPKARAFVLYGELHLARPHLPARLREALGPEGKVLVVHQNEISLYERAPANNGQRPEVLRLAADEFCVLNSVPWVKLRAYLDWLEGGDAQQEEGADIAELVMEYGKHLAELLELPSDRLSGVEVVAAPEHEGRAAFGEAPLHRQVNEFGRVGFLPSRNKILVPNSGTNAISEAAALALWRAQTKGEGYRASGASPALFRFMLGFLGSKILNPKRKCNEVKDMTQFLRSAVPGSPKAKVFARALSLLRPLHGRRAAHTRALKGLPELEAARIAGYVLGNRLFLALQRDADNLTLVRKLFSAEAANEKDANRWLAETVRVVRAKAPRATGKSEHF